MEEILWRTFKQDLIWRLVPILCHLFSDLCSKANCVGFSVNFGVAFSFVRLVSKCTRKEK